MKTNLYTVKILQNLGKTGFLTTLKQHHKNMIYQIKGINSSIAPCEKGQYEKTKLVSNSTVTIVELAKVAQGTFHQGKT